MIDQSKVQLKSYYAVLLIGVVYLAPLIIYGPYYIDDLGRSLWGFTGWEDNGRPLAAIAMELINFGSPLADISPIPQLLAAAILSWVVVKTAYKYVEFSHVAGMVASLPLIFSPFYLQNFSYKYDSLPMALSVATASLPFLLGDERFKLRTAICFICVTFTLSLYQASLNVYVAFAVLNFTFLVKQGEREKSIAMLASALVGLFAGYAVYSSILSPIYLKGEYNIEHSKVIEIMRGGAVTQVFENFIKFRDLLSSFFTATVILLFTPFVVLGLLNLVWLALFRTGNGVIGWSLKIIVCTLPLVLSLCLFGGPILLLENPVFSARVAVGVAPTMVCIFIFALWAAPAYVRYIKFIMIIPLFFMITVSYAYGNALKNQARFEDYVITTLLHELDSKDLNGVREVYVNGRMPYAPSSMMNNRKFPIIGKLLPVAMNGSWIWGLRKLDHYRSGLTYISPEGFDADFFACSANIKKDNTLFDIYRTGERAVISFKKITCMN